MPTSGRERAWHFSQAGAPIELRPRARLTLDDGEGLVEAVRAGLGVAQVPSYMAGPRSPTARSWRCSPR